MAKGINMDVWIVVVDKIFTDELWCKVDHQSTENFITGTLTAPKIAMIEDIFVTFSSSLKIFQDSKYIE